MRKIFWYLIPVVTLAAFVWVMHSADALKKPPGNEEGVPYYLQLLKDDVTREDWDAATRHQAKLEEAWRSVIPKIQYTIEREEFNEVDRTVARVRGAVAARDKTEALVQINELESGWGELGE